MIGSTARYTIHDPRFTALSVGGRSAPHDIRGRGLHDRASPHRLANAPNVVRRKDPVDRHLATQFVLGPARAHQTVSGMRAGAEQQVTDLVSDRPPHEDPRISA